LNAGLYTPKAACAWVTCRLQWWRSTWRQSYQTLS